MPAEHVLSDYLQLSSKTSTFVSIDVVGSTAIKSGENEQDVIYTFLAYHKMVSQATHHHQGEVFHIAGDGIVCRFELPDDATALALEIIENLTSFNKKQNHLSHPMSVRIGVHTGEVLESQALSSGQLISHTLDVTAKLQRSATTDRIRLSETTVNQLIQRPEGMQRVGWDSALGLNVYEAGKGPKGAVALGQLPARPKILIVEQELDEVVKLKKTLFVRRQDALPVYNQSQAVMCIGSWQPHLILISIELPWNQGWDLLRELRSKSQLSDVPIIAMSRQTTGNVIERSFTLGANGFLTKPLEEQQIAKRVETVMREFYL